MRSLLLACLALAACSSDDSDPRSTPGENTGPCEARNGSYLVHYQERSGDCGSINDAITVINNSASSGGGCQGTQTSSTDNCQLVNDQTCDASEVQAGAALRITGTVTWSEDASRAEGKLNISLLSGGKIQCSGIYDVTWTRQ